MTPRGCPIRCPRVPRRVPQGVPDQTRFSRRVPCRVPPGAPKGATILRKARTFDLKTSNWLPNLIPARNFKLKATDWQKSGWKHVIPQKTTRRCCLYTLGVQKGAPVFPVGCPRVPNRVPEHIYIYIYRERERVGDYIVYHYIGQRYIHIYVYVYIYIYIYTYWYTHLQTYLL